MNYNTVSGDRIPMGGTRFSVLVQTGPGAQPTSYTKGNWVSVPGIKQPGRGVDHPPSSAELKERVDLQPTSTPLLTFVDERVESPG